MHIGLRLTLSLFFVVSLVALAFAFFQVRDEKRSLRDELHRRAEVLAESLEETVVPYLEKRSRKDLARIVERFGNRERLAGVVVYDTQGNPLAVTSGPAGGTRLTARPEAAVQAAVEKQARAEFFQLEGRTMHVFALPLRREEAVVGVLALFHDATYIEAQTVQIWRDTLLRVLVQVFLIALITLLTIRLSIEGPIAKTVEWMKALRAGKALERPALEKEGLFRPLAREVTNIARSLASARSAAEEEARLREAGESLWTAERLRAHVQSKLQQSPLFVVSNREPYMHVRRGKSLETVIPASGLVTALQPILHACDGTWVAHGSGDADRDTVDERDRLRVPPEEPRYTLRRVWLTKEEEEGYYFGFSNEGLWPLCHIAHTRPLFQRDESRNPLMHLGEGLPPALRELFVL